MMLHMHCCCTHRTHSYFGAGLWERLTRSFGYLTTVGYTSASSGVNKKFTVVIGETGSAFTNSWDLKVRMRSGSN